MDTGADDTVFPERYAASLGLTPVGAPIGQAATALQATTRLWYAQVTLRIADNNEHREWDAVVGFANGLGRPLLGIAGFLEYFDLQWFGAHGIFELTVNANYPGI